MAFEDDAHLAVAALAAYERSSRAREGRVLRQDPMADLVRRLDVPRWIHDGGLTGEALRGFLDRYLDATTRLHHPRYYAHQVAVPHPSGSIAALVDGFTNNAMAVYEMGPPASAIELAVVNWMLGKVGFAPAPVPPEVPDPAPASGGGVLVHGGSLANLCALLAARGRVDPDAWRDGPRRDLVVVAPEASHYSIARAVSILGLGQRALVAAAADADGRLVPGRLGAQIAELRAAGRTPMAVVASACSTAVGLHDPLRAVAEVCRASGTWLHVDGAHGASALLSARLRGRLDGIELADSVVWDAHKMMRTPTLCAAVLMRDRRHLDQAFEQDASYLIHEKDQPGFDFLHRTVECTKAALGLRLFLVLAAEGEAGIARYVERQYDLALEAAQALAREPGFAVAVTPESNIVCFRVEGSDSLQLEIRRRLLERGEHYVSSTVFRGQRWLRLALMNPYTELADVEQLAAAVQAERRAVDASVP